MPDRCTFLVRTAGSLGALALAPSALAAEESARTLGVRLGAARMVARLRYLTGYWRVRATAVLPEARFCSRPDDAMSLGLCTVELPGADAEAVQTPLRQEHGVFVQAMGGLGRTPHIRGVRVSSPTCTPHQSSSTGRRGARRRGVGITPGTESVSGPHRRSCLSVLRALPWDCWTSSDSICCLQTT